MFRVFITGHLIPEGIMLVSLENPDTRTLQKYHAAFLKKSKESPAGIHFRFGSACENLK